jgi:hypothetical protein
MKTVGHSYHGSKDQYGLSVCEVALAMIPVDGIAATCHT